MEESSYGSADVGTGICSQRPQDTPESAGAQPEPRLTQGQELKAKNFARGKANGLSSPL